MYWSVSHLTSERRGFTGFASGPVTKPGLLSYLLSIGDYSAAQRFRHQPALTGNIRSLSLSAPFAQTSSSLLDSKDNKSFISYTLIQAQDACWRRLVSHYESRVLKIM